MSNSTPLQTTSDGTTLIASPQLKRLHHVMQDLIIAAYEHCTNRPGNSLALTRLQFAYEENNGEKSCTHYDVLVRDLDLNETIPLSLIIAVNKPDFGGL